MDENNRVSVPGYFAELLICFRQEHIEARETEGRVTVLIGGEDVGFVTPRGEMLTMEHSHESAEANALYHKAAGIASEVYGYMELMEHAPPLKVVSLNEPYKLLAEFNGYVLGGLESKRGVQFTTWQQTYNKEGLTLGHYCGNDYNAAKQDFAVRTGLIDERRLFTAEQLADIYHCCEAERDTDCSLSYEQDKRINRLLEQLERIQPDLSQRAEQEYGQSADPFLSHTM